MLHLGEPLRRRGSHALGGRLGSNKLWMVLFQLLQSSHKVVILGVGDIGIVQRVIAIVMVTNIFPQLFEPAPNIPSLGG